MRFLRLALLAAAVLIPAEARAQKIDQESARSIVLARVPNGTVVAAQLKVERGTLVYIYDIAVPGKDGLEELHVSAVDGQVVSALHLGAPGGQTDQAAQPGRRVAPSPPGP